MSARREAWLIPAALGSILGAGVLALSTKAVVLLVGLIGAVILANLTLAPLIAVTAAVPVNVHLAGPITVTRILIAGAACLLVYNASVGKGPWPKLFRRPDGPLMLLFLAASVMSVLVAGTTLQPVASRVLEGIIFFVAVTYIRDTDDLRQFFWALAVIGVGQGLMVVAETKLGIVLPGEWHAHLADQQEEVPRAVGTSGHPITLGGFYMVAVPCTICLILLTRQKLLKFALLGSLVLMAYAVYSTYSRSTWMGFAVMAFFAVALTSRVGRNLAIGAALSGFVFLAIYGFSIPDIIADLESLIPDRIYAVMRDRVGLLAGSESFLVRFENWAMAVNMWADNPIFGVGVGQSIDRSLEYLPSWGQREFATQEEAHNAFLMAASESGILAFIAFTGLWIWAFRSVARASKDPEYGPYAKVLQIILCGQFVFILVTPIVREIWLTLGVSAAIGHAMRQRATAGEATAADARPPGAALATPS